MNSVSFSRYQHLSPRRLHRIGMLFLCLTLVWYVAPAMVVALTAHTSSGPILLKFAAFTILLLITLLVLRRTTLELDSRAGATGATIRNGRAITGELLLLLASILILSNSIAGPWWPWLIALAGLTPLVLNSSRGLLCVGASALTGSIIAIRFGAPLANWLAPLISLLFVGVVTVVLVRTVRDTGTLLRRARRGEQRFDQLAQLSLQVVLLTNRDAQVQYVNQAVQNLLGYSAEEIRQKRCWPPIHPEDGAEQQRQVKLLKDSPAGSITLEYRTQHQDGRWVWLHVVGYNRLDDPAVRALVFFIEDFSQTHALQQNLIEQQTLLHAILDASPLTISATDLDGRLTATSRSFERRLGNASRAELRGKTIYEVLLMQAPPGHELDAFEMAELIHRQNRQIMTTGEALENVDRPGFLESDRRNWYKINKYPLRDPAGKVVGLLAVAHDITDQHEYQLRVEHQALHDPLTGLPNQRYLLNRLSSAIVQFQTDQTPWAVLFCDLDFFKSINKTHGHEFGDQCLLLLTRRILQQLPPQTLVARFGGDEFMILLPHISIASTRAQAEGILAALSQPLNIGEIMVKIPASIGIALLSVQHHSPSDLIREADAAMHQAKEQGRNRAELYDPSLQGSANRQAQMDIALRFAQERDELTLVYQPKVSLCDGSLQGFELLMRWNSPQFGNISPNEFIPLAEASGIVIPLGLWALEQACAQLRRWQLDYPHQSNLIIAVNVSMRQLLQPSFLDQVTSILAENQISACCIELELTETSAMANPQQTTETLRRLKKLGLRLALDDFGTGYSSLAYLQRLPLDVLKIDKAFVHGVGSNQSDTEIVSLILALAKTLKLATVAEGVERPTQLAKLTKLGCALGQGYIFAQGVPAQQAQQFLGADYRFSAIPHEPDHELDHAREHEPAHTLAHTPEHEPATVQPGN